MAMEVPERGSPETSTTGLPYLTRRTNPPRIDPMLMFLYDLKTL